MPAKAAAVGECVEYRVFFVFFGGIQLLFEMHGDLSKFTEHFTFAYFDSWFGSKI